MIESFHFDCDFRKPEYKIEFITDPEDILPKHSVIFKELDSEKATAITMIKRDGPENEYWVKNAYMDPKPGEVNLIDDIFGIPTNASVDDFSCWRLCTVSECLSDGVYYPFVINQEKILGMTALKRIPTELRNQTNNRYGPINVKLRPIKTN